MIAIGVRQLRDRLSHYLRRVKTGERLVVTQRGKSIAILSPLAESVVDQEIEAMLRDGIAEWSGGKPRGSRRRARIKGPSMTQTIIEGRQ